MSIPTYAEESIVERKGDDALARQIADVLVHSKKSLEDRVEKLEAKVAEVQQEVQKTEEQKNESLVQKVEEAFKRMATKV